MGARRWKFIAFLKNCQTLQFVKWKWPWVKMV
jgi:hypothetical protein